MTQTSKDDRASTAGAAAPQGVPEPPPSALLERQALDYHEFPRPGKTEVVSTKPVATARELSLAYTPGVAVPCLRIEKDPRLAYSYTNKGNLVAVITNGTAILGLGNIGALAGKPVMEGKGVLFKKFAGIDVFDIEVGTTDIEEFIATVRNIASTFGGINLEDVKAPECFEIERRLIEMLDIPVFHDDQHGTAIISGAALLNACEVARKAIGDLKIVISGAGAAGISCAEMFAKLGADRAKMVFVDSKGVVWKGRKEGMNPEKERIAVETRCRTLADAMRGADMFLGVSGPNIVSQDMVRSMATRPIVFALANPDPEIPYPLAVEARDDVIMATGRSDYPNQVNNALCFPFMFRGALDVRSRRISEGMKVAAARALADLAREDVPESVCDAYGGERLAFGPTYLIPKPFDPRVLLWVAPAVAETAVAEGWAQLTGYDRDAYLRRLERLLGGAREVMHTVTERARRAKARIGLPEADEERTIKAALQMIEEEVAVPVLVGEREKILQTARTAGLEVDGIEIVDPSADPRREDLSKRLFALRQRRGVGPREARHRTGRSRTFALTLLEQGLLDGVVTGVNRSFPEGVREALEIVGLAPGVRRAAALHIMALRQRTLFFADTSVNIDPTAEDLAWIAVAAADVAARFEVTPKVAMLSFSNFGSVRHPAAQKVEEAVRLVRSRRPDLVIDGEMHADVALEPTIGRTMFPQSLIDGDANILVFPDLASGNIGYKLVEHLEGAQAIGPILLGMNRPVAVCYQASGVQNLVHLAAWLSASAVNR
ncbi:MAG TPA: NADP-dependent malic enzyme [Planctomycetota bacterium]|nr:NADP-dependent malic enzyme [Planctomycetota bacterium]